MNLNEITLPAIAIEALYRKSLVDIPGGSPGTVPGPATSTTAEQATVKSTSDSLAMAQSANAGQTADNIPATQAGSTAEGSAKAAPPIRYLGNNNERITILVHYPEEPFIPEEQLAFLGNILGACKLNIGDTAIVNTGRQPADLGSLKEELNPRQLILLGDHSAITGEAFFVIKDREGISVLTAPPLETLNQDTATAKALKGRLWQCLKQLFKL